MNLYNKEYVSITGDFELRDLENEVAPKPAAPSDMIQELLRMYSSPELNEIMANLVAPTGKKSFLVFKKDRYINILTENIAFFYFRIGSTIIVTFDNQEYFVNYSLDQLRLVLSGKQFYRISRKCLLNFNAVGAAEHYFARKLLINIVFPNKYKLIVSKERVTGFLHWYGER
jgi:two-component system response regulator LytT